MQIIETLNELDALRRESVAVVYFFVEWSPTSVLGRKLFNQSETQWNQKNSDSGVHFYVIDISKQSGELWDALTQWFEATPGIDSVRMLFAGSGSMLWLQSGHIAHHSEYPVVNQFLPITDSVFSRKHQGDTS